MKDEVRIVLVSAAKAAHDRMLTEIKADGKTTINSSKMINWIVNDYFERFFQKRKNVICKAHFNERKCLQEALKIEDQAERFRALRELTKSFTSKKMRANKKINEKKFKTSTESELV